MTIEPITATAPRDAGRTVFTQTWARLSFLHWAVEPQRVAPYLPDGVRADTFDGATYVGLIPFRMQRVGLFGAPGVPYLGSFNETNVRLYSVDAAGRRGVVFVTLDASRLAPVLAARALGLPYVWSRMRYHRRGAYATYTSRRFAWPRTPAALAAGRTGATEGGAVPTPSRARSWLRVRIGARVDPGPLEHFLTARWGLHQADATGRTAFWPNEHGPWPLHTAEVERLDDEILDAVGFGDLPGRAPDSVLFSPGVDVRFGPRRVV